LPGNLTSLLVGKGRAPTSTPALSTPAPVGNDARLIRHPDGRIELTGSLIRVDVVPLTLTARPSPKSECSSVQVCETGSRRAPGRAAS